MLDSSKLKEFADNNLKFDENGRKLSKWVGENTLGKGEIARYEQFLLFPQCFQKACFSGASKGVIVWEWVKKYSPCVICTGYLQRLHALNIFDLVKEKYIFSANRSFHSTRKFSIALNTRNAICPLSGIFMAVVAIE